MNSCIKVVVYILLAAAILIIGSLFSIKSRSSEPFKFTVEVIDGCEYLRFAAYYHDAITHKGNCKNHEQ